MANAEHCGRPTTCPAPRVIRKPTAARTAWNGAPEPFLIADRTTKDAYSSWAGYVQADYALSRLFSLSAGVA